MTPETKEKLTRLTRKAWAMKESHDKIKAEYDEAKSRLASFLAQIKLTSVESDEGTATRVVPTKTSLDKEKVAGKLKYKDYVAISTVSISAAKAIFPEEELKEMLVEEQGSPYMLLTPAKK